MSPRPANHLDAFIKSAQYLASLTTQQDVWSETGNLLINFWGADIGGFGERGANGEIVLHHLTFSTELSEPIDLASEAQKDIAEVLDSGFLTWRLISSSPEPLVVAFLPITQANLVTSVLLVGHRTSGLLPKDLLNIYLALAGLVGTMAARLASEAELRKHRQHLEELINERTVTLTRTNEQLHHEIIHRQRAEGALRRAHDDLEFRVQERTVELQSAKEAIAAERQRLYDVLETLPVYVCLLDSDYYMPFANRYFREAFGEPLGRRCYEFLFDRTEPCETCETYTVMKTGAPHHWYWTGPNGRDYDIYDFPFIDQNGSMLILEMGIDFTERKKAEEALKETLTDLTRSNEDLQQFAYVASHDLQEPLRNVASCLQLLEKKYKNNLDADADLYIRHAVEGAVRMKALIQDLLTYSRVATSGKPPERINCEQILEQTLINLRASISDAGAVIDTDSLPSIVGDASQLSLVFQNLIHNAIKFRRDEQPKVQVSAVKKKDEWVFSVKDNGIGIDSRHMDRIFVIFQRLNKRSEYEGTGMGLAIAKKVVERHGGRIWVESQPGVGTTFYFTIPEKGMRR